MAWLTVLALSAALAQAPRQAPAERAYMVVVEAGLEPGFAEAGELLAKAHGTKTTPWQGDFDALEQSLLAVKPAYLALVLSPGRIDANLPRRLVPWLARFDRDPFVDCAWGVITGANGKDAKRFVEHIVKASKGDLPERFFSATSVVVDKCMALGPARTIGASTRVLERAELWVTGKDPKWKEFLEQQRAQASKRGLVEWGHCGDSQGIWLFSMYRNGERDKHWPFDPSKVGQDPEGEMPRMGVKDLLEGVDLYPAVVINGACHSAVTRDTMTGGDIVSTFGDTGGVVRFFPIEPEDSFPLMAIRHGATAYIAPLAANNANRSAIEQWWIETGGVPLGEVVKRTADELVLGDADHVLEFELFEDGKRDPPGAPMFDGTVHRVLFGDPAFVPWREARPTSHALEVDQRDGVLRVALRWTRLKEDPWVWQPWRQERTPEELGRMCERITLESWPAGEPKVTVVEAFAERGKESAPLELRALALLERGLDGEPILQLEALGSRKSMDARGMPGGPDALRAVFEVRFEAPRTGR